uniref:Uncharacterized protein n=1 Tax=Arundo donax TaxID=35708 RepID=A0A0A9CBG9_ARUDO
MAERWMEGS